MENKGVSESDMNGTENQQAGSPLLGPGELWLSPSYWRDRRVVVTVIGE